MRLRTAAGSGVLATVVSLLAGCAGSGENLDLNGRPIGEGGSAGLFEPTIESIQDNVFTPICAVCHAGASAPQGLVLSDAQTSYDNLVDVRSAENGLVFRVHPGDPAGSYLIHKIEGTQTVGSRMPFGCPTTRPCLDEEAIAVIRQWITNGAAPPIQ